MRKKSDSLQHPLLMKSTFLLPAEEEGKKIYLITKTLTSEASGGIPDRLRAGKCGKFEPCCQGTLISAVRTGVGWSWNRPEVED